MEMTGLRIQCISCGHWTSQFNGRVPSQLRCAKCNGNLVITDASGNMTVNGNIG